MIDIHCHILPGVDDGAKDWRESTEMARIAFAEGIRHIVATPHFTASHFNHSDIVRQKTAELQQILDQAGIRVTVYPGNEVRMESADFIYEHGKKEHFCYLGKTKKYVLLEQRWAEYDKHAPEVVKWFIDRGTKPIIPHPERHTFFRKQPQLLTGLIEAGAWTQVSVDSLLGKNSEDARTFSHWLIDNNYVHTLATDAHNLNRKPNLSLGFAIVEERAGAQRAQEIRSRLSQIVKDIE